MRNSLLAFGWSRRSGRRTLPLRRFVLSPYPASIRSRRTSLSHSHHRFLALIPRTRSIICDAFHAYHSSGCPLRDMALRPGIKTCRVRRMAVLPINLLIFRRACFPPVLALLSLGHPLGAFPAPGGSAPLCFSGSFPKKSPTQPRLGCGPREKQRARFLAAPAQTAPLALGSRAHSRRVARGCPERNSGKSQTEDLTQWHSTKTPSSSKVF
jgi:hypothetical protein